jgi:hypothetical protein
MDKHNSTKDTTAVAEQMQDAVRRGVEQIYGLTKQQLDAWATSSEATLKASFDLQNAVISATRSLLGPTGNFNQAMYNQWADAVSTAQKATLKALDATKRLTKQLTPEKTVAGSR